MINKNIKKIFMYNIDMFSERLHYSFKTLYNKYYNDINNILYSIFKVNKLKKSDNNFYNIPNTISAFNNEYTFDNFCCFCLNPKLKDIFVKLDCGHEMHYVCYVKFIKSNNEICPFCKKKLNILYDFNDIGIKDDNYFNNIDYIINIKN
jgi:hypothetical protein